MTSHICGEPNYKSQRLALLYAHNNNNKNIAYGWAASSISIVYGG